MRVACATTAIGVLIVSGFAGAQAPRSEHLNPMIALHQQRMAGLPR